MTTKTEFVKNNQGLLFGDIVNGNTGDTAEDIWCQVHENADTSESDEDFFYSYNPETGEHVEGFSPAEILDIKDDGYRLATRVHGKVVRLSKMSVRDNNFSLSAAREAVKNFDDDAGVFVIDPFGQLV